MKQINSEYLFSVLRIACSSAHYYAFVLMSDIVYDAGSSSKKDIPKAFIHLSAIHTYKGESKQHLFELNHVDLIKDRERGRMSAILAVVFCEIVGVLESKALCMGVHEMLLSLLLCCHNPNAAGG